MAKKSNRQQPERESRATNSGPNYWMIVAIIAVFFSVGLVAKMYFFTGETPSVSPVAYSSASEVDDSFEREVQLISSNFKCACGGCGELPLIECECDMPRGAKEEKAFMRRMLKEGLSVEQVIELVDQKYGHKAT